MTASAKCEWAGRTLTDWWSNKIPVIDESHADAELVLDPSPCREYDLAFAFEARPEHNAAWEAAVQQRSKPAVHYINKGKRSSCAFNIFNVLNSRQSICPAIHARGVYKAQHYDTLCVHYRFSSLRRYAYIRGGRLPCQYWGAVPVLA